MLRQALLLALVSSLTAAATAQSPYSYAPPAPPTSGIEAISNLAPGTLIVVHQRGTNIPIQCTLAWVNPRSFACDTAATNTPAQRLTFPANSIEYVRPLAAAAPPPPAYVEAPQPQIAYAPAPQPVFVAPAQTYFAPPDHHQAGVVVLCAAAGALLGGLIGKGWSTEAGVLGAAFGGLTGGGIGFAATEYDQRNQYATRVPIYRSHP